MFTENVIAPPSFHCECRALTDSMLARTYRPTHGTGVNLEGAGDCPQGQPLTHQFLNAREIDLIPPRPPQVSPLRLRPLDTRDHSLADQITLELGNGA